MEAIGKTLPTYLLVPVSLHVLYIDPVGTIVVFNGNVQRHGTEHNSETERKNDEPLLYGFFVSLSQLLAQEKERRKN